MVSVQLPPLPDLPALLLLPALAEGDALEEEEFFGVELRFSGPVPTLLLPEDALPLAPEFEGACLREAEEEFIFEESKDE